MMAIFAKVDPSGIPEAFYDDRLHAVDETLVPIGEVDWRAHLSGQTRRWDGAQWLPYTPPPPPPPPLDQTKEASALQLSAIVKRTRAMVAGTDDPAKLAEYADKAALAPQIIAGTAPADAVAATREEALDLGLQDIPSGDTAEVQLARIWEQKAADLRAARNVINRIERTARTAIQAAQTADEVDAALADAQNQLEAITASGGA